MKRLVLVLVACIALEAVRPDALLAQGGCGDSQVCSCCHKLPGPVGGLKFPHADCRTCVEPGGCHPDCIITERLAPGATKVYAAIIDAAHRRDVQALGQLASKLPGFVFFNEDRSSIQVLKCSGDGFSANVKVRGFAEGILAARLPRSGTESQLAMLLPAWTRGGSLVGAN
jgi:hypothetical protein